MRLSRERSLDLAAGRQRWIQEAPSQTEREQRQRSDFLKYENQEGEVFDFHALRHGFITHLAKPHALTT